MNTDKNDMIQNTPSDIADQPLSQPSVQDSTDETAGVEQKASEQGESLAEDAASSAQSELSRYQTENASLREKLLESKARYTAYTLGISEERIDYAIRLAGLDDIDVNGADADKQTYQKRIERRPGADTGMVENLQTSSTGHGKRRKLCSIFWRREQFG